MKVQFSAGSGWFSVVRGASASDRLTFAGLAPEATVKVPGEAQITVPVASAVQVLEGSGTTEAVVKVPGAPTNQDAIAVGVSGISADAQGDVSVTGRPEKVVQQSQLKNEATGLDTKLPPTFQTANVSAVAVRPDVKCEGTGSFACYFDTEITKFGVRGETVVCPVWIQAAANKNKGTIYDAPFTNVQPPTDPAVKFTWTEDKVVTWGHAFSRLAVSFTVLYAPRPPDQNKFPYKVKAFVYCTDKESDAWIVASLIP